MRVKKYIIAGLVLIAPLIYMVCVNQSGNPDIQNNMIFQHKLSSYRLWQGKMAMLKPSADVELMELSSTLFTDYAEKQRLIRLPAGRKIILNGSGLPDFPEQTLIAKTFYYKAEIGKNQKIIETRLLFLKDAKWNVATYKWNKDQNEAFLIEEGATVAVKTRDPDGKFIDINYRIPGKKECVSCHHSGNAILPIGPKVRNLNRMVAREGKQCNQLEYLIGKGLIESTRIDSFLQSPDYKNKELPVEQRARAYMDINCAHCHQPAGYAGNTTLNLNYTVGLNQSGIPINKNNIIIRMNEMGEYHMPKLGTTVQDKAGIELIRKYLKSLK